MASKKKKSESDGPRVIAKNKKALREYQILETVECGIVLHGTEVKSIRAGLVQIGEAYVRIRDNEAFLIKANISEYSHGSWTNHKPDRPRKLLMHRREINRLRGKVEEKGLTLVPLSLYLTNKGLVKVEVGLGRGKKYHDKREDLKKRDAQRDIARVMRRGTDH